ncbi:MAG: peptidoglycan DD-metalloendopeptidase family protein [Bacteroidetes bacterium]|nr:peptidoglycan DD-metalloendopeptidase family protein [Bacteroidota bacterium]
MIRKLLTITVLTMIHLAVTNAQVLAFYDGHDDDEEEEEAEIDSLQIEESGFVSFVDFDHQLIPCADLYHFSWDSLNVDLPRLDAKDSSDGICLSLVESDCGYFHPCPGDINSDYGWRKYRMHKGVDIDLETGDSVFAAFDGVVRIAKYNYGGFGNYVLIRHYNGLETLYGHLSVRLVQPNQTVRAGEVIGLGGSTGRSTGPHLHFETRYKGLPIDPNRIIAFDSQSLKLDTLSLTVQDFKAVTPPPSSTTRSSVSYYKVKSGDTLWSISRRYGTTVDRICRLNGISRNSTLRIGQRLRIR